MEIQDETLVQEINMEIEIIEEITESIDEFNILKYELTEAEKYDVDKILEENSKLTDKMYKQYYLEHREQIKTLANLYYQNNREERMRITKERYRVIHKEKLQEKYNKLKAKHMKELKQCKNCEKEKEVYSIYCPECIYAKFGCSIEI